jgi:hypothetical protein
MPEEVQSRFTVYDRPYELPGKCCVCGASDRPVVDFGRDIEWDNGFGRAYFCKNCIKQAASKFPSDEIQPRVMAVDEWNSWKRELLDELTGVITANQLPPGIVLDDSVFEQAESEHAEGIKRDEPESSGTSDETDESTSKQGTSGVPSLSGVGLFPDIFNR